MGRPRGDPSDQAARGYPGQRKSKTEKAIAEAERQAKLLALPRAEETSEVPAGPSDRSAPGAGDGGLERRCAAPRQAAFAGATRTAHVCAVLRLRRRVRRRECRRPGQGLLDARQDGLGRLHAARKSSVSRRDSRPRCARSLGQVRPDAVRSQQTAARRRAAVRFRNAVRRRVAAGEIPTPGEVAPALVSHDSAAIGSLSGFDSAPPGAKPN